MSTSTAPDLIITADRVFTSDPQRPWAEAVAVTGGLVSAVGGRDEVLALAGSDTEVVAAPGPLLLPGFSDGHAHLGLGGGQAAWELPLLPTDPLPVVLEKVRAWAEDLAPDAWVVGGIVGSTVMDAITSAADLTALDKAAGGRPVLLRDDSMHNRWVSSRALELMGVHHDSSDPEGGTYVRDREGRLTGVLHELASAVAEGAADAAVTDPDGRNRVSLRTALATLNSYGITSVQDAATMEYSWKALAALEADGEITAWVVGSCPARDFIEAGTVGEELLEVAEAHRSRHVRPDFVKYVLDGIPMTRTSAMLRPYVCHSHDASPDEAGFTGASLWTDEDLLAHLRATVRRGLGAKLHATGDATVRQVLDAVQVLRAEAGDGPRFHIAHVEFIDPADLPRFAELGVVPDASPYIWYPSVIQEIIAKQIPEETVAASWAMKDLVDSGAKLAAGSDWPCALPSPDPWTGLETMVTRANPDPAVPGALNPDQRLSVEEAVAAFTRNPAEAMGLGEVTGSIRPGLSADLIAVDQDIFTVDPATIHTTRVLTTWFEGTPVFERDA